MKISIKTLLPSLFALVPILGYAQLNVISGQQSGNGAEYYVQNILLGAGVTAFNVTFQGDSAQIGEFSKRVRA